MSVDLDRIIDLPLPPIYWVADMGDTAGLTVATTDQAEAERWADNMAAACGRQLRVMREAGVLATVYRTGL